MIGDKLALRALVRAHFSYYRLPPCRVEKEFLNHDHDNCESNQYDGLSSHFLFCSYGDIGEDWDEQLRRELVGGFSSRRTLIEHGADVLVMVLGVEQIALKRSAEVPALFVNVQEKTVRNAADFWSRMVWVINNRSQQSREKFEQLLQSIFSDVGKDLASNNERRKIWEQFQEAHRGGRVLLYDPLSEEDRISLRKVLARTGGGFGEGAPLVELPDGEDPAGKAGAVPEPFLMNDQLREEAARILSPAQAVLRGLTDKRRAAVELDEDPSFAELFGEDGAEKE